MSEPRTCRLLGWGPDGELTDMGSAAFDSPDEALDWWREACEREGDGLLVELVAVMAAAPGGGGCDDLA